MAVIAAVIAMVIERASQRHDASVAGPGADVSGQSNESTVTQGDPIATGGSATATGGEAETPTPVHPDREWQCASLHSTAVTLTDGGDITATSSSMLPEETGMTTPTAASWPVRRSAAKQTNGSRRLARHLRLADNASEVVPGHPSNRWQDAAQAVTAARQHRQHPEGQRQRSRLRLAEGAASPAR